MIKELCFSLIFMFYLSSPVNALDWKELHEQADQKNIPDALILVKEQPDSLDTLYILGLVYLNNHKDIEAEKTFRDILVVDSDLIEAQWGLAEVLRRKNKIPESEELLSEIIKSNPEFSPAYISLAYIRYTQANFEETVRLALKVKKQGRQNVDLSNYTRAYVIFSGAKGMIASQGGPLSKVINGTQVLPNLKKAEELQPDSSAVLFGLGSFYFLAPAIAGGSINKALEYLQRAVEADPQFADAYVRLAQVYKSKGEMEKYQDYLKQALEIDPNNELAKDEISGICKFNCVTVQE
ncbi:MAG: tetratricopeptide repeat protein [Candidatus Omnitrophota bacterium]|jgi:tetratricopeptide (TPR) repeat protein